MKSSKVELVKQKHNNLRKNNNKEWLHLEDQIGSMTLIDKMNKINNNLIDYNQPRAINQIELILLIVLTEIIKWILLAQD
jgi:hypothetical protein